MRQLHLSVLLYLISITALLGERLHEQIYSSIEGSAACFRRLNGTHQAGCSSADNGAIGVVHMVKDRSDAQWLALNGTAGPYVAVVSFDMFNNVYDIFMEYPSNVAGVLLYQNSTEDVSYFTHDARCPNEYSSAPGSQCPSIPEDIAWNRRGTGLLQRDIPFPIFLLPSSRIEEIDKIKQCFERYNLDKLNQKGKPLCSLQMNSFMFAAVNSAICLRRSAASALLSPTKVCDPLGDHNVYYSLFPRGKEDEQSKKNITFVTARIDTASLFDGVAPGAASSVVGMVTLIAAASTLSKMIPSNDSHLYDQNVLWTLFNGEAFDYIGSQRVAYDISRGMWPNTAPISPQQIKLHVEVGQIGGSLLKYKDSTIWPMYGFAPYDNDDSEVAAFLKVMSSNSYQNNTVTPIFSTNLPPSSLHSFRRILKNATESKELLEVVLVDYNNTFSNMYYNSALDDYDKIDFRYHNISIGVNGTFLTTEQLISNGTMMDSDSQVKIARLATTLARSLYQRIAAKPYEGNISTSAHMIDEMLYCYLRSQACRLLMAADYAQSGGGGEETLPTRPASLYVGVTAWAGTAAVFAGHLLALLAGTHLQVDKNSCDALYSLDYSYYWLRGWNHTGVCIQTTMNFSQAVSPAFLIPDYEMSSGVYSSWTESVWQAMSARVFVTASGAAARDAAAAGLAATLTAAFLTYWLRRRLVLLLADVIAGAAGDVNDEAVNGIIRTANC